MLKRWKELLFALVLGLICPLLIFSMLEGKDILSPIKATQMTKSSEDTSELLYLPVLMPDGSVNKMELDEYLIGVVLQEMPVSFESEALKAQSVVARTYALRRYEADSKHTEAAVCIDSSCCQGYKSPEDFLSGGGSQESLTKVSDAVLATTGQVLVYNGKLIDATYFSSSGGVTEDAKAVWGADVPYLQSTASPGEEQATYHVDTQTFTLEEFASALNLQPVGQPENWIGQTTYTKGGGVDTMFICGQEFKGTVLRQRLGLRSTAIAMVIVGSTVTVTTKGYGHRVGMSQYGADAMAVKGSLYPDILAHYYKGTQLISYDGN